ncbi:hypothetical protein FOTG_11306 [Fusarium oxysporum f. sp. vasinfectum 25433]|uniref:Uncharacterized protein n=1 Tax=Fusarium oxysporum f. sp. vasinfectum 25433 TaxID=1089449 RepID=X0L492_FUSOX|nr:hypothetical protein FOTG_11306 [Fusarium oxysporum f. sp. vasinfectum 25433]
MSKYSALQAGERALLPRVPQFISGMIVLSTCTKPNMGKAAAAGLH